VPSLRLLSIDARAFGRDRVALARAVAAADADIACVHGGPRLLRWRSICAAIGRRSGLVVATGGRLGGGNLLLTTLGIDVTAVRDFRFTGGSGLLAPGAALAALRLAGADFVLAGASLAGNAAERVAQARELQRAIDGLVPGRPPAIVSAEGSDRPGTAAWQALVESRVGVAGRIFVDGRLGVDQAAEIGGGTRANPTVVVELTL
jgi:hypothetical protein